MFQCTQCLLDTTDDPAIAFDAQGVCSYCHLWKTRESRFIHKGSQGKEKLSALANQIRGKGKNKPYDCIAGVSGGVDSTYVMYCAKELGLRPLVVHLDNGWNSELAVKNIEQIVRTLGFDLHTHVVRWEEFRDLHLSFLRASVVDIELPTDHAIFALLNQVAVKQGVRYILSGYNIATEGTLPNAWVWNKLDWLNIESIHKQFGTVPLRTFPHASFWKAITYQQYYKIHTVQLLDYLDYDKEEAKKLIQSALGWKDYGGKHFESVFTRFYQAYILPNKFKIDKRKAHFSSLICSGQITKAQAMKEMEKPAYDQALLEQDKEFVLKKLNLTPTEFEEIMRQPMKSHLEYPSYLTSHYKYHQDFFNAIRPVTKILKKIYQPVRTQEYS